MVELEDVNRSFHCPNEAGKIKVLFYGNYRGSASFKVLQGFCKGWEDKGSV